MKFIHFFVIFAALIQHAFADYSCYTTPDATSPPSNIGYLYSGDGGQCSSFQYTCSESYNTTCTAMEIQSATVKWFFTYFTQSACNLIYTDPTLMNVCCCNTDSCNSPSLKYGCNLSGVPNNPPIVSTTSSMTTAASKSITTIISSSSPTSSVQPVVQSAGVLSFGSFGTFLSGSVVAVVMLLILKF